MRELGADVVINRTTQNVLEATRAATAGEGADAVYDAVGAATIEASLRATRKGGICVLYGGASGPVSEIPDELTTGITYQRTGLATYLADAEAFRGRMAQLFAWYREGKVVPRVGGTYSLDQTGEALAAIASVAGGIDKIKSIVRVCVFVASTPDFTDQPKVANGASTLCGELFGEAGKHVRSAVGVASLPLNASVELEMVAELG